MEEWWEIFFEKYGHDEIDAGSIEVSINELYDVFKERLLAELDVKQKIQKEDSPVADLELFSLEDQNKTILKGLFNFTGQFSLSMTAFHDDGDESKTHRYDLSRENIYFLLTVFGNYVQGEASIDKFSSCNNQYQLLKFALVENLLGFSIGTRDLEENDHWHDMYLGEEDIYWLIVRLGNFLNMGDIPK